MDTNHAVLTCVIYGPALRRRWKHQSSRTRTLHFSHGVCEESEDGVWRYLKYLGLRRELGKTLWPEGQTAERGAYRPPRVDVYYWANYNNPSLADRTDHSSEAEVQKNDQAVRSATVCEVDEVRRVPLGRSSRLGRRVEVVVAVVGHVVPMIDITVIGLPVARRGSFRYDRTVSHPAPELPRERPSSVTSRQGCA